MGNRACGDRTQCHAADVILSEAKNRIPIISKRVEPLRVRSIEEEVRAAERINEILLSSGIKNARACRYLGLVYDSGNFYILMNDEKAPSLYEERCSQGLAVLTRVEDVLPKDRRNDLDARNALWNAERRELILIDFESHASVVDLEHIPPNGPEITAARKSR